MLWALGTLLSQFSKVTRCAQHYPRSYPDFLIDFSPELSDVTSGFFSFSPEVVWCLSCLLVSMTNHVIIVFTILHAMSSLLWLTLLITVIWNHRRPWLWVSRPVQTPHCAAPPYTDCQTCSELAFYFTVHMYSVQWQCTVYKYLSYMSLEVTSRNVSFFTFIESQKFMSPFWPQQNLQIR